MSLIKLDELPDLGTSYNDKIFHFLAYFVLPILWYSAFYNKFKVGTTKAIMYSGIFSFIIGVIIELLQGGLTESRVSDIYDVGANTFGIIIAVLVLIVYKIKEVKKI
ncbi:VanZ family protein [uncultured Algibacter sp.]|uniref:VanZ family protein n=1 Tax=uncultured Algibacter sp. TaxID=298659 RepID=UPI0026107D4C|nr:VanZ family protein [uncultured Algibacter sp.]